MYEQSTFIFSIIVGFGQREEKEKKRCMVALRLMALIKLREMFSFKLGLYFQVVVGN